MSWHTLANSTTVDASDLNDNFSHIGSGSRLPMSSVGASMANTTDVYDLGSSSYRWGTAYIADLNYTGDFIGATGSGSLWMPIYEETLTDTATSIEITGLNGDEYTDWFMLCVLRNEQSGMIFNGDSATNYGYQYCYGQSNAAHASRSVGDHIRMSDADVNTTTHQCIIRMRLFTKTGYERTALIAKATAMTGKYVGRAYSNAHIWNNTADTITTIKIYQMSGSFLTGTTIQLWARK